MFGWFLFGVFLVLVLVWFFVCFLKTSEKRTVISKDCSASSAFLDLRKNPCGREQGDAVSVGSFNHSLHFVLTNKSHKYKEMRLC